MFNISSRPPMYDQSSVQPMRDELVAVGFTELLTPEDVESAIKVEKKQKGEQFQIIEPALMPSVPVSPNPKKLFLITIFAGLGLGAGLVFLLEALDTSVRKREDLEEKFGLAILASVPRIFDDRDVSRHRLRRAATLASVCLALVLTAGFASLSFIGVEKTFEMVGLYG